MSSMPQAVGHADRRGPNTDLPSLPPIEGMTMKRKIRLRVDSFRLVSDALDSAIQSAMDKTDKWCEPALTDGQRRVLEIQTANYFWLALSEAGVEIE